jgi:hypothetical protein
VVLKAAMARDSSSWVTAGIVLVAAAFTGAAASMRLQVGYLRGLSRRRIAELHPGEVKTDGRDAFVIADGARTLPQALLRKRPG